MIYKTMILSLMMSLSSAAMADCWKLTGPEPMNELGIPFPKAVQRICAFEYQRFGGQDDKLMLLKLYADNETIGNIKLRKKQEDRLWRVDQVITATEKIRFGLTKETLLMMNFPFSDTGEFYFHMNGKAETYGAEIEK